MSKKTKLEKHQRRQQAHRRHPRKRLKLHPNPAGKMALSDERLARTGRGLFHLFSAMVEFGLFDSSKPMVRPGSKLKTPADLMTDEENPTIQ